MPYTPHSDSDIKEMLAAIGVNSIDELFKDIPVNQRFDSRDWLPAQSEQELLTELEATLSKNKTAKEWPGFIGGGYYRHFIPSVVDAISSRGEFLTSYTPYQPEVSQGTLQVIFEFQSLICALTGMDIANASLYDGSTAVAEAVNLARSVNKRKKVAVSQGLHPRYIDVLKTYAWACNYSVEVLHEFQLETLQGEYAAVVVAQPDFWGSVHDYRKIAERAHANGTLFIVSVNPTSLALLKPPASYGADVVVGDGQPLGITPSLGGPCVGLFATKQEYLRMMPGRIVGQTVDHEGKRGFVLTMQTREQHIRREKATSNICTNQGLMALRATLYLSLLGPQGLRKVAERSVEQSKKLMLELQKINHLRVLNELPVFHEFTVELPMSASHFLAELNKREILGGLDVGQFYPDRARQMIFCCTELTLDEHIEKFLKAAHEIFSKTLVEV